jgi:hypothetical protein
VSGATTYRGLSHRDNPVSARVLNRAASPSEQAGRR